MNEENDNPSLHPWQMNSGQLDQESPSNKPVRALAFGLPRTTLLMGLMFVAGIVWGIYAGRQYRPLIPERIDLTSIQLVDAGMKGMFTEATEKKWEEKNAKVVESLGLPWEYRAGLGLGNPFAVFVPPKDPAAAKKPGPAKPDPTAAKPTKPEASLEDAPSLEGIKLQSTLVGAHSSAIVNGQRVRIDSMLNGWKIVKIGNGFIEIDWKGNRKTIYKHMQMNPSGG